MTIKIIQEERNLKNNIAYIFRFELFIVNIFQEQ